MPFSHKSQLSTNLHSFCLAQWLLVPVCPGFLCLGLIILYLYSSKIQSTRSSLVMLRLENWGTDAVLINSVVLKTMCILSSCLLVVGFALISSSSGLPNHQG